MDRMDDTGAQGSDGGIKTKNNKKKLRRQADGSVPGMHLEYILFFCYSYNYYFVDQRSWKRGHQLSAIYSPGVWGGILACMCKERGEKEDGCDRRKGEIEGERRVGSNAAADEERGKGSSSRSNERNENAGTEC